MDFQRICLQVPPSAGTIGGVTLKPESLDFIQADEFWGVHLYDHHGLLSLNSRAYTIQPGTLAIFPPGTRVQHDRVGGDTFVRWLGLKLAEPTRSNSVAIPRILHLPREGNSLRKQWEEASASLSSLRNRHLSFGWELLWSLAKPHQPGPSDAITAIAEDYVNRHLSQKIRVEDVAKAAGVSYASLLSAFQRDYGISVIAYVRRRRVDVSRQLLLEGRLTVKQIATRVGVPDLHQFNKLIREATGLSPTALRNARVSRAG